MQLMVRVRRVRIRVRVSFIVTGPPNEPILVCLLASVVAVCRRSL